MRNLKNNAWKFGIKRLYSDKKDKMINCNLALRVCENQDHGKESSLDYRNSNLFLL